MIATTLAPILLTLLLLHEMRIFIQFQQDNYCMVYHAYKLYTQCGESDFKHLLDVMQGSGMSISTFIFMFLSNGVVLCVPILNLIQIFFHYSIIVNALGKPVSVTICVVNILCFLFYVAGAVSVVVQYRALCRKVSPDFWCFAVSNHMKLAGASRSRYSKGPHIVSLVFPKLKLKCRAKGDAWEHTINLNSTFNKTDLLSSASHLNRLQRKSLLACLYDSWLRPQNSPKRALPQLAFVDVTARCNLQCSGCYASDMREMEGETSQTNRTDLDIDFDKLRELIPVLREGGVKALALTGGEPTAWNHLFDLIAENPDLLFLVFTNGQKQLSDYNKLVKKLGNLIFIFSVDGSREVHEARRGSNTYQLILQNLNFAKKWGNKFGFAIAITVTKKNCNASELQQSMQEIFHKKPVLALFFRFNSVDDDDLALSDAEYAQFCKEICQNNPCLTVNLPFDEQKANKDLCNGCVACKYIFHIRRDFSISACPYVRQHTAKSINFQNLTVQSIRELLDTQEEARCKFCNTPYSEIQNTEERSFEPV